MAQVVRMAHEKKAYVLCERATYLGLKNEVELIVLVEGDDRLLNRYSVITVSPEQQTAVQVEDPPGAFSSITRKSRIASFLFAQCRVDQQQDAVSNMLRKLRPSVRYRFKFGGAVAVPVGVIQRQILPQSAAEIQHPCSAGVFADFATRSGVFPCVEFAGGFDSRRLHF